MNTYRVTKHHEDSTEDIGVIVYADSELAAKKIGIELLHADDFSSSSPITHYTTKEVSQWMT